jgi:hypothetical protein
MYGNMRRQTASLTIWSLLGIAVVSAWPVFAQQQSTQQTDAQKRIAAFAACHKEADAAVPQLRNEQDDVRHYTALDTCLEKRGYALGVNARANQ